MAINIRLDKSKLMEITNNCPERAAQVIQKIAQDCETEIKMSFSSQSPSPEGEPPGVVTGALKNSIVAEPRDAMTWVLHDGVEYGIFLEYGTVKMAARPFFLPAIERVVNNLPDGLLESVVE